MADAKAKQLEAALQTIADRETVNALLALEKS